MEADRGLGRSVSLRTQLIALMFSEPMQSFRRALSELRRRVTGQPHTVSVFLELDDPYSYLLSQYLPSLVEGYDIELCLHMTQACGGAFRPRPDMLARYAERDCEHVRAWPISFTTGLRQIQT